MSYKLRELLPYRVQTKMKEILLEKSMQEQDKWRIYFRLYNQRFNGISMTKLLEKTELAYNRLSVKPKEQKTLITLDKDPDYPDIKSTEHILRYRSLVNYPTKVDFAPDAVVTEIDKLDHIYTARMAWKNISRPFLNYVYGAHGYILEA